MTMWRPKAATVGAVVTVLSSVVAIVAVLVAFLSFREQQDQNSKQLKQVQQDRDDQRGALARQVLVSASLGTVTVTNDSDFSISRVAVVVDALASPDYRTRDFVPTSEMFHAFGVMKPHSVEKWTPTGIVAPRYVSNPWDVTVIFRDAYFVSWRRSAEGDQWHPEADFLAKLEPSAASGSGLSLP